jgi:hypothetical protein
MFGMSKEMAWNCVSRNPRAVLFHAESRGESFKGTIRGEKIAEKVVVTGAGKDQAGGKRKAEEIGQDVAKKMKFTAVKYPAEVEQVSADAKYPAEVEQVSADARRKN